MQIVIALGQIYGSFNSSGETIPLNIMKNIKTRRFDDEGYIVTVGGVDTDYYILNRPFGWEVHVGHGNWDQTFETKRDCLQYVTNKLNTNHHHPLP